MKNNKGFTVVELIASFALAMVVFILIFEVIVVLKDVYIYSGVKTELLHRQAMISNKINETLNSKTIKIAMTCGDNCLFFVYDDNTTNKLVIDKDNNLFTWGDYTTKLVENSTFGTINISNQTTSGVAEGKKDSIITIKIPVVSANIENQDFGVNIAYQYDSRTSSISSINLNEQSDSGASVFLNGPAEDIKRVGQTYTDPGYFVYYADGTVVFNDPNVTVTSSPVDVSGQTYNITYSMSVNGETVTTTRLITVVGLYIYNYTGAVQTFTVPVDGVYKIELWGASGGNATYTTLYTGGFGAYTSGNIYLSQNQQLYIYVGGAGQTVAGTTDVTFTANGNGYNGGAPASFAANNSAHSGGGGATDVRLVSGPWDNIDSLKSRIMTAAGGGGASSHYLTPSYSGGGGYGGSLVGGKAVNASNTCYAYGLGGTNVSGGTSYTCPTDGHEYTGVATFGIGKSPYTTYTPTSGYSAGGGGGYYGGGSGFHAGAGGGSSFISGYAGVNAITSDATLTHSNNTKHYSNNYFINGVMQNGVRGGNGSVIITYVAPRIYKNTNKLETVRYIKDCINGNSTNSNNAWIELQAISNGNNVAKGKTVTSTGTINTSLAYSFNYIVDGNINPADLHAYINETGLQCITVDLGNTYNLDEIAVWHYWADGRTYNENTTSVSLDNINWTAVINTSAAETQFGKRFSAYGS